MSLFALLYFSTIGFAILIIRSNIEETISEGCLSTSGVYNDLDEIYVKGSELLCSEKCPCYGVGQNKSLYGAMTLLECPGARDIYSVEQ